MQSPRETIYAAVFAAGTSATITVNAQQVSPFQTTSRRWKHWSQVPAEEQPAFFQVQRKEHPQQSPRGLQQPALYTIRVDWIVYVNTGGDQTVICSSLLNPILDALEATLPPQRLSGSPMGAQTLGIPGIVDCRIIDEEILIDEDVNGSQAFAIVPVRILAN